MIPFQDKKYNIIYADPPWQFNSRIHQENRGFTHSKLGRSLRHNERQRYKRLASSRYC